jgi:chorismate mutase
MNTTVNEIDHIDEMLLKLSKERLQEVRDFIGYLLEKEKKRKAFEDRIANIEQESDTVTFDSVEDAMNAIRNWNG